jgi:hypothetical protein
VVCASINPAGGVNSTGSLLNEYSYGFRAASAMTVIGVELFTQTFSKTIDWTMRTAIYRQASGSTVEPARESVARGEVGVSPKLQFYTSWFSTPVSIAKRSGFRDTTRR